MTLTTLLEPLDDLEAGLVLDCGRPVLEDDRAARVCSLAAAGPNWNRVLTLARRHGLVPLVHWHLSRLCPGSVPPDIQTALGDQFQKNAAFSALLTGELRRLLAGLREHGVEAMPFKGPALAVRVYGHIALRQFGDLDVLVRERDVWRASEVIEAQGFVPDVQIPADRRERFLRDDYVRLFRRDGGRTIVELHWGVARRSFAVRYDDEVPWRRVAPMPMAGGTVLMPADEDLLLMLVVHGTRHSWDKLEGLCSLGALVRSADGLDWDYVWRQAERMHCRRMVAFAVRLAHALTGSPLPAGALSPGASSSWRSLAPVVLRKACGDGRPPSFPARVLFELRLKDSMLDRAQSCARVLLTPTADDWAGIHLRGPLALAYPLLRVVRVTRRHVLAGLSFAGDTR